MLSSPPKATGRYHTLSEIGRGGMGKVVRALDRLTGDTVALKQVASTDRDRRAGTVDSSLALALAEEFRVLAGLRHPHIVAVLDYGFDDQRVPFYTMQILEGAAPIHLARAEAPLAEKVRLLVDMLQALVYLHRRGILHRDLKPANVLVTADGQVKVLDFGLATLLERAAPADDDGVYGTVHYNAPELFLKKPASFASDLYAAGIIIHEVLAGRHPFADLDTFTLITTLLTRQPDLSGLPEPFVPVVRRLLQKDPAERFPSAEAVIAALCAAAHLPPPPETPLLRESFLQATTFIGRRDELKWLASALDAATLGASTAWLVAGESGVGKSRLLDELRTQALVRGALVLRGQAVEQGGLPYQMWRDAARRLLIEAQPSEGDAGLLRLLAPDVEALTGQPAAPLPDIDGTAAQARLALALAALIRQQPQPVVLLLEDIQWAEEGLAVLRGLLAQIDQIANLLIVGTYRADEAPALADGLPGAQVIRLPRLNDAEVAQLAQSMIGEAGAQPDVVALLQAQTEGNTFFMVEMVRALAEDAGALANIGRAPLPASIAAGGVAQVMRRRLGRVPAAFRPMMECAAVAARALDLRVIGQLDPALNQEDFLAVCASAGVLEVADNIWRFSHAKLRETVLAQLDPATRSRLHQQVAEAIERAYPGNDAYAAILTDHWLAAGAVGQAAPYAAKAVEADINLSNFGSAIARARAVLAALPPDAPARAALLTQAASALERLGEFEQAADSFSSAAALAEATGLADVQADALRGLGVVHWYRGENEAARASLEQGLALYRALGHSRGIASCLNNLGIVAISTSEFEAAKPLLEESLSRYRAINHVRGTASALNNLGLISDAQRNHVLSRRYYAETLDIFLNAQDRWGEALAYHNLGAVAAEEGDYDGAKGYLQRSIELKTAIGDQHGLALSLIWLASAHLRFGASADAVPLLKRGLEAAVRLKASPLEYAAMAGLGMVLAEGSQWEQAADVATFLVHTTEGAPDDDEFFTLLRARLEAHFGSVPLAERLRQPPLSQDQVMALVAPLLA